MQPVEIEARAAAAEQPADSWPRAFWYCASASQRLTDRPLGVRVLDRDLALYRDAAGVARALEDRCAHRGAQLSLGEVNEGALACRYHGWRYGRDGRCAHIPSLIAGQSIPRGVGVRVFPCREADGYLWVWMGEGDPSEAPPRGIAYFRQFNWAQGVMALNCAALAAIENNLDWCHPTFAHPHTHPQFFINQARGFQDQAIEARRTPSGLTAFWPPSASAVDPVSEASVALVFELPDRVTVAFSGPQGPMRIVLHMVPTGPNTCRQEWMISTGPAGGDVPTVVWSDEVHAIFEQDRELLESVQRAVDREGRGFERSAPADAPTLIARRIYTLAAQGHWPGGAADLPKRRIVKLRS
ncbi:MAG: Rieske 2Fe-2S domain-containing protein [Caulobacterales bacterium]